MDPDVLSWMFVTEPPLELLTGLFELRRMIEPQIVALAAERRTQAAQRDGPCAGSDGARNPAHPGRAPADEDFHAKLIEACGSPFLTSLSGSVTATIAWSTTFKYRTEGLKRDSCPSI